MEMFRRGGICLLGYQFCPFLRFLFWIVVEMFRRGSLFVRVSILTFSTIFLLDCGENVQTGWYLFARVSMLTFSTISIGL